MNDNPPAFPVQHSIDGNWQKEPVPEFRGMSLRDWFAGQALARFDNASRSPDADARKAFQLADAMLAERAKGGAS